MTTYLITHRSEDSQLIHREGSAEEAACEIANQLLMFYGPAEKLMAIKSDSPLATFSLIKDDVDRGKLGHIIEKLVLSYFQRTICDVVAIFIPDLDDYIVPF